jgi:hypothetical protein
MDPCVYVFVAMKKQKCWIGGEPEWGMRICVAVWRSWKKKKIKVSCYMPWRLMGERRYNSYSYWTSALDGGEWSASRPGRALPPGKGPPVHWIGGWVGPRAGLDAGARRKILCPCRGSNLNRPVVKTVVRHYIAWATAAHGGLEVN